MTITERTVGSGIAKRKQIKRTIPSKEGDPPKTHQELVEAVENVPLEARQEMVEAFDEFANAGHIFPHEKFEAFLEQQEDKLAEILEYFRLPEPGRFVVRDKDDPRGWRYSVKSGNRHENGARRTEWYLMTWRERAHSFWYLGLLLFLLQQCRSAFDREAWLELAGRAYKFGYEQREMELKFSGEKRLQAFENRETKAADKGNATKKQNAAKWHRRALQILSSHPDIDPYYNARKAACEILKNWPADEHPPAESTLRKHLAPPT